MRQDGPYISVVIPTYNRPGLLRRAVLSVLRQTFTDLEVIVSDDCSAEPAAHGLPDLSDPRVRVVRANANKGNGGARNAGVREARGEWVAFLDDDDEMLPNHLEMVQQTVRDASPELGFCWSGVQRLQQTDDGAHRVASRWIWRPEFPDRTSAYLGFLRSRRIGTTGLVVRRSAITGIGGFDEKLRAAVDTDLLIRLARDWDFCVVPEITITWWDHSGPRVRSTTDSLATAYERIIEKHLPALSKEPSIHASLLYKLGWLHYHAGNKQRGRESLTRCIRINPRKLKPWGALCLFEMLGRFAPEVHRFLSNRR